MYFFLLLVPSRAKPCKMTNKCEIGSMDSFFFLAPRRQTATLLNSELTQKAMVTGAPLRGWGGVAASTANQQTDLRVNKSVPRPTLAA